MNKNKRKPFPLFPALLLCFCLLLTLPGCGKPELPTAECAVTEDEEFGAAFTSFSMEQFNSFGFQPGDSVDVAFEGGPVFTGIPYFTGYYVRTGSPLVVAYPGYPFVSITRSTTGIWGEGLRNGQKVTITLHRKAEYLSVQETLSQSYSFDRADYDSDEVFANFRTASGGRLKENLIYRGASPVDNSRGRAETVCSLMTRSGIAFILDLADTEQTLAKRTAEEDFRSDGLRELYSSGAAALLGLNADYTSGEYREAVAEGVTRYLSFEGPIYVHCLEGKDRTGFVCLLLEALAGASYDELLADYLLTYRNYFGITPDDAPEKAAAVTDVYFGAFCEYLWGTDDPETLRAMDLSDAAERYLLDGGMTREDLTALAAKITA